MVQTAKSFEMRSAAGSSVIAVSPLSTLPSPMASPTPKPDGFSLLRPCGRICELLLGRNRARRREGFHHRFGDPRSRRDLRLHPTAQSRTVVDLPAYYPTVPLITP